ncbi:MAG: type II toxin-antitoxin system RelE/ParE family toxin [Acidimicrobiales bacterium]
MTDELPSKVAAAAWELIDGALRDNPQRLGKPLRAPHAGHWVARRSSYRVRSRIDEDRDVITVLDIRGRADWRTSVIEASSQGRSRRTNRLRRPTG